MRKLLLSTICFCLFSLYSMSQKFSISGPSGVQCGAIVSYDIKLTSGGNVNEIYTLIVSGGTFTPTNDTISGLSFSSIGQIKSIPVKWSDIPGEGYIEIHKYGAIPGTETKLKVRRSNDDPIKMVISTSGNYEALRKTKFDLSIDFASYVRTDLEYTIIWTDSDGGRLVKNLKRSGDHSYEKTFASPGNKIISAQFVYGSESFSTSTIVNINYPTESTLNTIVINGNENVNASANPEIYHITSSVFNANNQYINYEWSLNKPSVGSGSSITPYGKNSAKVSFLVLDRIRIGPTTMAHPFRVSCRAIYTYQGVSVQGNVINKDVTYSLGTNNRNYQISNTTGLISISEIINDSPLAITNTSGVTYQLNNILTGHLAAKGIFVKNGSIDTRNIPKGIYVLTLVDSEGETISSEKVVIQ